MKRFIQLTKGTLFLFLFLLPSLILIQIRATGLLFFRRRSYYEDKMGKIFARHGQAMHFLYYLLYNTRVHFESTVQLPKDRSCLILSNHKGASDFFLNLQLFSPSSLRFIVKKSLQEMNCFRQVPGYSLGIRLVNYCSIDRALKLRTIKRIQEYVENYLEKKQHIIFFPEGTRHKEVVTKSFITSAIKIILRKKNVPIVLVAASNGHKVDSFLKVESNVTMRIKALGVFSIKNTGNQALVAEIERFRSLIDEQLLQWEKIDKPKQ